MTGSSYLWLCGFSRTRENLNPRLIGDRSLHTVYLRDQESGLDYAMNRYMSNSYGRFQSPDKGGRKLHVPSSLNRYVYTGNDPINFTDATGNEREGPPEPPYPPPPGCYWTGGAGAAGWGLVCSGPGGPYAGYDEDPLAEEPQGVSPEVAEWQSRINGTRSRVAAMLGSRDCATAIGAKDLKSAVQKGNNIKITYDANKLTTKIDEKGQLVPVGELAHYNPILGFRAIELNSNVNWDNPNATIFHNADGTTTTFNLMGGQAALVGAQSITVQQFLDLTVLHELAHSFGYTGREGHESTLDPEIWKNCFKN